MSSSMFAINHVIPPSQSQPTKLVLFGELFQRGYANGLIDEAEACQIPVIYSTVGRRDSSGQLEPIPENEKPNTEHFINIPLEAGIDLTPLDDGRTLVDFLAHTKLTNWEETPIPKALIEEATIKSRESFRKRVRAWVNELKPKLKMDDRVHIAHLMAGGVPRAKILFPLLNRVVKGTGDRFLSSEKLWNSQIGSFIATNFHEVTAYSLQILIEETDELRKDLESSGGSLIYSAYGYHGTAILIGENYQWQSYSPYLQGWAKIELENIAKKFWSHKVKVVVYNCPEILTRSSAIFHGVEIPLYPFIEAIKKESLPEREAQTEKFYRFCASKVQDLEKVLSLCRNFYSSELYNQLTQFEAWPQHNHPELLASLLETSEQILLLHQDPKDLLTFPLSELILKSTGQIIFRGTALMQNPVVWLNHDILAKQVHAYQIDQTLFSR